MGHIHGGHNQSAKWGPGRKYTDKEHADNEVIAWMWRKHVQALAKEKHQKEMDAAKDMPPIQELEFFKHVPPIPAIAPPPLALARFQDLPRLQRKTCAPCQGTLAGWMTLEVFVIVLAGLAVVDGPCLTLLFTSWVGVLLACVRHLVHSPGTSSLEARWSPGQYQLPQEVFPVLRQQLLPVLSQQMLPMLLERAVPVLPKHKLPVLHQQMTKWRLC